LTIFKGQTNQNKQLATEYALRFLSEISEAKIVKNSDTGCGTKMLFGVKSDLYGLVHITCTSNVDANGSVSGWGPKELSNCNEIDHIAFVWADKNERVLIFILKYDDALNLSKKNNGNYSKTDIKNHVIKGGFKIYSSAEKTV
jgi:hypothetical protein